MKSKNPNWLSYTEYKMSVNKFMHLIGFKFTSIEEGKTVGVLAFDERHEQQNGFLHGGISSAILDMVTGFASYTLVGENKQVFTVESKVCYYNKGKGTEYFAEGRVDKAGRSFHFCEGEIYYINNNEKIIVAKSTTTMAIV
jgi:uncharacterized protein (TIGR00369 family)